MAGFTACAMACCAISRCPPAAWMSPPPPIWPRSPLSPTGTPRPCLGRRTQKSPRREPRAEICPLFSVLSSLDSGAAEIRAVGGADLDELAGLDEERHLDDQAGFHRGGL